MDPAIPSTSSGKYGKVRDQPQSQQEGTRKRKGGKANADEGAQRPRLDPDLARRLLECPVCLEVPRGHIYTCWNNHNICKRCYDIIKSNGNKRCPVAQCQYPRPPFRMKSIEQMVEQFGFKFPCANEELGCKDKYTKNELLSHGKKCGFRLVGCPLCEDVQISRNQMAIHFNTEHDGMVAHDNLADIQFYPTRSQANQITLTQGLMTAEIGDDVVPFFFAMAMNNKHAIIAVKADLDDPRFQGVECTIKLKIPNVGTTIYRGPLYDLETSSETLLEGAKGGLIITTKLIEANHDFWPDNTLEAEFYLKPVPNDGICEEC